MTIIGIAVTVVYIGVILVFKYPLYIELQALSLNELGDFLAGVFGPLTLFWLILGYIQQQKELSQNTEALRMQAEELKNSVVQQIEQVKMTRLQVDIDHQALEFEKAKREQELQPIFSIPSLRSTYYGEASNDFKDNSVKITLEIKNTGKEINDVQFSTEPYFAINLSGDNPFMGNNHSRKLSWEIYPVRDAPKELLLRVTYKTQSGNSHLRTIHLILNADYEYNCLSPHQLIFS